VDTGDKRFTQVDALRAFAVTGVIVHHTFVGPLALYGRFGVQLFFVISGFLITGILLDARAGAGEFDQSRTGVLRAFYARRALRIFPIYYLTLAVGTVIGVPTMRENLVWNVLYLSNWKIAVGGAWAGPGHIWSLAVEEQFYLLWPLIVLFAPRRVVPWTIGAMIIAGPATRAALLSFTDLWLDGVIIVTPTSFDSLGLGALLALLWRTSGNVDRIMTWFAAAAVALFALQLGAHWVPWIADPWSQLTQTNWPLLFAWCVHRVARGVHGPVGAFLLWRPLIYIGTVSYGVYLFHFYVIIGAEMLERETGLPMILSPGPIKFIMVYVISLALASLSWTLIERPINNQKRRFPYVRTDALTVEVTQASDVTSVEGIRQDGGYSS